MLIRGRITPLSPSDAVQGPIPWATIKHETNILVLAPTNRCTTRGVVNHHCLFRFLRHEFGTNDSGFAVPVWAFQQVEQQ